MRRRKKAESKLKGTLSIISIYYLLFVHFPWTQLRESKERELRDWTQLIESTEREALFGSLTNCPSMRLYRGGRRESQCQRLKEDTVNIRVTVCYLCDLGQ